MVFNKKGVTTFQLITFIFLAFFMLIFVGVAFYGFQKFDSTVSDIPDFTIGNISFQESYQDTLGNGIDAFTSMMVWASLAVIFGMVLVMLVVGYTFHTNQRLFIILDIFIIIVAFILAVYISQGFETFINSNPEFLSIFSNEFYLPSLFVLTLPFSIPIIGILIMLVSYIAVRKKEPNVLAYQG